MRQVYVQRISGVLNFSPGFLGANAGGAMHYAGNLPIVRHRRKDHQQDRRRLSYLLPFLSISLSYGGFLMEDYFDQRMSWIQYPVKRLVLECLCYFIYVFIICFILIFLYSLFIRKSFSLDNIPWKRLIYRTKFPMQISFFISFIFISRSFLMEWRKAAIEAEQLKTERFAQQYQSLKDQLNPHFLFNSLNVLSNLVYESPDASAQFIRQLSRIYRYVLDMQHEELVPLEKGA